MSEIRAIKFRSLGENDHEVSPSQGVNKWPLDQYKSNLSSNKEYSHPAVLITKVCFSIDRSKQESNFLLACINQAKRTIGLTGRHDSRRVDILKSVNLDVPYGCIFGLLGPSSCGKTTLLRCLVGLLKPSSGSISLFGHETQVDSNSSNNICHKLFCQPSNSRHRSKSCKVPGPNVGYMPQDLGLYEDFSIRQLLQMFGKYMRMDTELIHTRIKFMASFLDLPDVDREIASLSGGQKRRVSFAIACLHMPPLIILDEPTVGVDPLLRQSIWKYLRKLADQENKTIIITTHYIEEASKADQIALMRSGEILVQDTPSRIMQRYNSTTLEKAFLRICNDIDEHEDLEKLTPPTSKKNLIQEEVNWNNLAIEKPSASRLFKNSEFILQPNYMGNFILQEKYSQKVQPILTNDTKLESNGSKIKKTIALLWALLYKNYKRNVNSIPLLAFQFMLPMIQMISFSLCVGGRPTGIGLGLVNHDKYWLDSQPLVDLLINDTKLPIFNKTSLYSSNSSLDVILDTEPSEEVLLSNKYLNFIDSSMISVKTYLSLEEALKDVRAAKLWAAMEIGENFTDALSNRLNLENFYELNLDSVKQSVIKLYPDRSNKILDMICLRSLTNSYRKFISDHFEHFRKLPIELKEPIFDIKPNLISNSIDGYTESIAAGLLASLTYIMAAGLTTFIMVVERSAGILERTYTSGVNPVAYLLAHAIFRSLVMMLQIAAVMILTFYVLQQPLVGSVWLAYLMLITLNLTGIAYGLFVSSLVSNQNGAALTIVSSLVVKITLSGILWPLEAIPRWLRLICYVQPLTMPVQALKSITLKGGGTGERAVQLGFLVSLFWLLVFLIISARRFKFYQH